MQDNDFPFRKGDANEFKDILKSMTRDGLTDAFIKFEIDDEDIKKLRGKWEAYHLLAYASHVKSRVSEDVLKQSHKDSKITPKELQSIPGYGGGATNEKQQRAFDCFRRALGVSRLHIFVDFLEFCCGDDLSESLPLSTYNYDHDELKSALADKKAYLQQLTEQLKAQKRLKTGKDDKYTGLGFYWSDGNNSRRMPTCKIEPCYADKSLRIPSTIDNMDLEQPSTILGWSSRITSFIGREKEIQKLTNWLESDAEKSIQLIAGDGGVGKTRMAFHFAESIAEDLGWSAGQVTSDLDGCWLWGDKGMLLIIDYPEERKTALRQFLKAVYEMDDIPYGRRLRILLLSRDKSLFDEVEEEAPRLSNQPLHLGGLDTKGLQWDLIESTWTGLQNLKIAKSNEHRSDNTFASLTLKPEDFWEWQNREPIHQTPLMVMSFIFYLYCEPDALKKGVLELKAKYIIRYMTKREIRFIRKEVEEYFGLKKLKLPAEPIIALKALAAINDGFCEEKLNDFYSAITIDFNSESSLPQSQFPETKYVKELSIFNLGVLQSVQPDIMASDFLYYCLTEVRNVETKSWLCLTLFGVNSEERMGEKDSEITSNFSRLSRLIYDAQITLKLNDWPLENLIQMIIGTQSFYDWVSFNLGGFYQNQIINMILYQ